MATNSSVFSGSSVAKWQVLHLVFNRGSQDVANNRTNFSYEAYIQGTGGGAGSTTAGIYSITGATTKSASNQSWTWNTTTKQTIASGTFYVNHNSDGTLATQTLNVSVSFISYGDTLTASTSVSLSVATIPRASQPSLNVSTQALGSAITISTNRASTSFTHKMSYVFGTLSGTIKNSTNGTDIIDASTVWTLPIGLASAIPNDPSGTGTITCKTFNGSTEIGTKSVSFIATVPNNATFQPTATISSIVEGNTLPSEITVFVQHQSKAKVTSTGTPKYNATIKTYSVSVADIGTYSGSVITSGVLRNSGDSVLVTLTVTDSRGLTGSTYQDITVVEYSPPQLPVFNASRSESTPVNILASFDASISPVNNQNNKKFRIRSKASDGGWAVATEASEAYVLSGTQTIVSDPDKSYTIEFFVQDSFTSITQTVQVGTAFTLLDFNASGKGMAVGKVSEIEDEFEVAMPTTFMSGITSYGGGNLSPATTAYHHSNGVLVDICPATLQNMVIVDVIGHGYLPDIPFHSIFQTYHFEPFGTLIATKQTNISGELLAGRFLIDEGRLKLWFQQTGNYQTLIVRAYVHGGKPVKVSVSNVAEPSSTYKVTCALTRGWNSANSNSMTGSGGNGNGRYMRFSDGTQICYHTAQMDSGPNTAFGSIYGTNSESWTYPASFVDRPSFSVTEAGGLGNSWGGLGTGAVSLTNASYRIYRGVSTATKPLASLTAIGRWK